MMEVLFAPAATEADESRRTPTVIDQQQQQHAASWYSSTVADCNCARAITTSDHCQYTHWATSARSCQLQLHEMPECYTLLPVKDIQLSIVRSTKLSLSSAFFFIYSIGSLSAYESGHVLPYTLAKFPKNYKKWIAWRIAILCNKSFNSKYRYTVPFAACFTIRFLMVWSRWEMRSICDSLAYLVPCRANT